MWECEYLDPILDNKLSDISISYIKIIIKNSNRDIYTTGWWWWLSTNNGLFFAKAFERTPVPRRTKRPPQPNHKYIECLGASSWPGSGNQTLEATSKPSLYCLWVILSFMFPLLSYLLCHVFGTNY